MEISAVIWVHIVLRKMFFGKPHILQLYSVFIYLCKKLKKKFWIQVSIVEWDYFNNTFWLITRYNEFKQKWNSFNGNIYVQNKDKIKYIFFFRKAIISEDSFANILTKFYLILNQWYEEILLYSKVTVLLNDNIRNNLGIINRQ